MTTTNKNKCWKGKTLEELKAKREYLRWVGSRRACKRIGHDWVTEIHFGPDSGSEYITCSRCGEIHRNIYY